MKYVFGLLLFASFFFSEVSLASAYSFTKQEMAQMSLDKFEKLSPARMNELIIIYNRYETDDDNDDAYELIMALPQRTRCNLRNRANGIQTQPTQFSYTPIDNSPQTVMKYIGIGVVKGATVGAAKHVLTGGMSNFF